MYPQSNFFTISIKGKVIATELFKCQHRCSGFSPPFYFWKEVLRQELKLMKHTRETDYVKYME